MNKVYRIITLAALVVLATEAIFAGSAPKTQKSKPAITLAQARKAALSAVPGGKIKSAEYEKEAGQWIYSFDIATPSGIREVWVDPNTGAVVKNEAESAAAEKAEHAAENSAPKH